jgi:predicted MPP superfamily phosphohydrolase
MFNPVRKIEFTTFELSHPAISEALAGRTIAQISDIHLGRWVKPRHLDQIVDAVNGVSPDLIALTGDYVGYNDDDIEPCARALAGFQAPAFAVLGNHDHWTDAERATQALERSGINVLANEWRRHDIGDGQIDVVGVDDHVTGHDDVDQAFGDRPRSGFCLVLNHVPSIAPDCAERGGHLILSGHTHGYQFALPGLGVLGLQQVAESLGIDYYAGPYRFGGSFLYITRGIGSTSWPLRIFTEPEVSIFRLEPGNVPRLNRVGSEIVRTEHRPE